MGSHGCTRTRIGSEMKIYRPGWMTAGWLAACSVLVCLLLAREPWDKRDSILQDSLQWPESPSSMHARASTSTCSPSIESSRRAISPMMPSSSSHSPHPFVLLMKLEDARGIIASGQVSDVDSLLQDMAAYSNSTEKMEFAKLFSEMANLSAMSLLADTLGTTQDDAVVRACQYGLASMGVSFLENMAAFKATDGDELCQKRLATAVSMVTNPVCVLPLSKMAVISLHSGAAEMAGAAAYALRDIATPEAQAQLVSLASLPDFPEAYAEVLQGVNYDKLVPALTQIAVGKMGSQPAVRLQAVRVLAKFRRQETLEAFEAALNTESDDAVRDAMTALLRGDL
jgi:hypothetical protein